MIVTLAAKIKIKPTADQLSALQETIRAYRQGCKLLSAVVFDTRELSCVHCIEQPIVCFETSCAYAPKDLVWNRDYSLSSNQFSVNTLHGRIKVPFETKGMEKYFDGSWVFGTAKLLYKHRKWFLHISSPKKCPYRRSRILRKL